MLVEYVEDNYYARLDTHSYHRFRETHFNARLNVNNAGLNEKSNSPFCAKSRSRALGHSACFKSILRTIILQDLTLTAFNVSEKSTYMQDST